MEHNFIIEESEVENRVDRYDGSGWQSVGVNDVGFNA